MPRFAPAFWLAAALLSWPASPALAADLPPSISGLREAIAFRVDDIGPSPVSRAEAKEAAKLARAAAVLERYGERSERSDFRAVGKAGRLVAKSLTTDPAVRTAVDEALLSLGRITEEKAGPVEAVFAMLTVEKYRAKLEALSARATSFLALGRDRIPNDPVRAGRLIWKARRSFVTAAARGAEFLAAGGGPVPPGVTVRDGLLRIENVSETRYFLRGIEITGEFRNEMTGFVTLEADGVEMATSNISGFPGEIPGVRPGSSTPRVYSLDSYLVEYRWRMTPVAEYSTAPHGFEGTLVLLISNRRRAKAGEALWRVSVQRQAAPR